jgi:hypothetical protein
MWSRDISSIPFGSELSPHGLKAILISSITGPKRFEQDKSWLRLGLAIRTALDINLHRVALSKSARQGLPDWLFRMIIRTWLLIYVVDRTISAQFGKPTTLREEHGFQVYFDLISQGEGKKTIDDAWVSFLAVCLSLVPKLDRN